MNREMNPFTNLAYVAVFICLCAGAFWYGAINKYLENERIEFALQEEKIKFLLSQPMATLSHIRVGPM